MLAHGDGERWDVVESWRRGMAWREVSYGKEGVVVMFGDSRLCVLERVLVFRWRVVCREFE